LIFVPSTFQSNRHRPSANKTSTAATATQTNTLRWGGGGGFGVLTKEVASMNDSFDFARRDINRDAVLEAIGVALRAEHGPVEEPLPGRLAALLDQLQNVLSQETE
jgi:hypothetical protein